MYVLEGALTFEQLRERADKRDAIEVVVAVDVEDLMQMAPESSLDAISEAITGDSAALLDISLTCVGARHGKALISVYGSLAEFFEDEVIERDRT